MSYNAQSLDRHIERLKNQNVKPSRQQWHREFDDVDELKSNQTKDKRSVRKAGFVKRGRHAFPLSLLEFDWLVWNARKEASLTHHHDMVNVVETLIDKYFGDVEHIHKEMTDFNSYITFKVNKRYTQSTLKNVRYQLIKMLGSYANALLQDSVRVMLRVEDDDTYYVDITIPYLSVNTPHINIEKLLYESLPYLNYPTDVTLGQQSNGNPIVHSFQQNPILYITGRFNDNFVSRYISHILMSLLFHAKDDEINLHFITDDMKRYSMFMDLPHTSDIALSSQKSIKERLYDIYDNYLHRQTILDTLGFKTVQDYNKVYKVLNEHGVERAMSIYHELNAPTEKYEQMMSYGMLPEALVVIDTEEDVLNNSELYQGLNNILKMCQRIGVYFIISGSHHDGSNKVYHHIKPSHITSVCFDIEDTLDEKYVLGKHVLQAPLTFNEFIVKQSSQQDITICYTNRTFEDYRMQQVLGYLKIKAER